MQGLSCKNLYGPVPPGYRFVRASAGLRALQEPYHAESSEKRPKTGFCPLRRLCAPLSASIFGRPVARRDLGSVSGVLRSRNRDICGHTIYRYRAKKASSYTHLHLTAAFTRNSADLGVHAAYIVRWYARVRRSVSFLGAPLCLGRPGAVSRAVGLSVPSAPGVLCCFSWGVAPGVLCCFLVGRPSGRLPWRRRSPGPEGPTGGHRPPPGSDLGRPATLKRRLFEAQMKLYRWGTAAYCASDNRRPYCVGLRLCVACAGGWGRRSATLGGRGFGARKPSGATPDGG